MSVANTLAPVEEAGRAEGPRRVLGGGQAESPRVRGSSQARRCSGSEWGRCRPNWSGPGTRPMGPVARRGVWDGRGRLTEDVHGQQSPATTNRIYPLPRPEILTSFPPLGLHTPPPPASRTHASTLRIPTPPAPPGPSAPSPRPRASGA